jgi:hypothetical protein
MPRHKLHRTVEFDHTVARPNGAQHTIIFAVDPSDGDREVHLIVRDGSLPDLIARLTASLNSKGA